MIEFYLVALILIFFSGLPALARGRWARQGELFSVGLLLAGALLGLVVVLAGAWCSPPPMLAAAWSIPGGRLHLELDPLAGIFLLPALLILGLGGVYGLGYLPRTRHGAGAGRLRVFYGVLGAAIALLPLCRNGLFFLMAWEIMAICGFLLILTEQEEEAVRRAAYVYLAATHTGTLALFAMFILLDQATGSFAFPAAAGLGAGSSHAAAVFLLALFGFGLKAGLMPLHIWLPGAHAAAPSHVSALMSGVMIKMGIYGLVRVSSFYSNPPLWWGGTVLVLGVISAVLGVALALAQHDIKRLLAYHSVENIGIILIGLGCALLGQASARPDLVTLGLAGALLHVVNHGLFKSLLFLGAGSVIMATGTRKIDQYGGLLRAMPRTGLLFLGGAVAICGLPPLNGFVSEWFIYLGLLGSQKGADFSLSLAVLAAPALAMTGALAVACFVKVFGITFLGTPRREFAVPPTEAPATMLLPMAVLFFSCLLIGLAPWLMVPLLQGAIIAWQGTASASGAELFPILSPVVWLSAGAFLLLAMVAGFWRWQRSFPEPGGEAARPATWGCSFRPASARMQYTATSFVEQLTRLFRWGLWGEVSGGRAIGFFPLPSRFADHTPDPVLDRLLHPSFRTAGRLAARLRAFFHRGWLGVYLLYSALTICLLLFWFLE
jgi:hydrogenase-4 component B